MASTQSKIFYHFLRLIGKKKFLEKQLSSGKPSRFDCPRPTAKVKRICHVETFEVNGCKVFKLSPKIKSNNPVHILYLHGGAYMQTFNWFHWSLFADLVKRTNCTIIAPDYPLAPAHSYKESFDMVTALYAQVLTEINTKDLILMGDSSGGGFALALAQHLRNCHYVEPGRPVLLSPWLDITLSNPDILKIETADTFLEKKSLQKAGELFARGTDPSHFQLSPINGTLENLGKISLFIGSREILLPDARKLKALAASKNIDLEYFEFPDMVHGWMFLNFPESRDAREKIFALVRHIE